MGEVISLEAERIKREAKKLMQAENWLQAHQSETQKFLDYRKDQAFADFDHVSNIWIPTPKTAQGTGYDRSPDVGRLP
jgi:hypothetical protein